MNKNKAPNTIIAQTSLMTQHALPLIGYQEIESVTSDDINLIYDSMEDKRLKQNTIFGMRSALGSFFNYALEKNLIAESPVRNARVITPDRF